MLFISFQTIVDVPYFYRVVRAQQIKKISVPSVIMPNYQCSAPANKLSKNNQNKGLEPPVCLRYRPIRTMI